ncbi:hypothetical protein [Dyella japonica]|uniref:Tetratricopeptide repeat protein n=1 Tax=Dyella japonica A8 TaxID=1217721 RepID=A0A075JYT9_9GAMM|nr:hypothetical protein [Dyella japonica]AIF47261.1 hypothetical protein HY57_08210 [Dyella japonica A8]
MAADPLSSSSGWRLFALALLITALVYWPGLYGGWLFDDYPNIVDNHGVQPSEVNLPSLVRAALSSPASDFRRPLASLSFAVNYLTNGLDPFGWKLTNLVIHLLNGALLLMLSRRLLVQHGDSIARRGLHAGTVAALIAGAWLLLPINLTAVLYVVQREESLANIFVLTGLIGYVIGRQYMLGRGRPPLATGTGQPSRTRDLGGLALCATSVCVATCLGLGVKETAAMLPLYAFLIEWFVFGFGRLPLPDDTGPGKDWRLFALFFITLALPLVIGVLWLLPSVLSPMSWATRDFTLATRLLSEARIVCDYLAWTLLPSASNLSFYHDQFVISQSLFSPWSTMLSLLFLAVLVTVILWQRRKRPLLSLGLALFLAAQLLTGTIVPLELVYEHRNYFASFGLLLAVAPLLAAPLRRPRGSTTGAAPSPRHHLLYIGKLVLAGLLVYWTALTAATAVAWGEPLELARELAQRAPDSPRAQYELGRAYIIYSGYNPSSPYIQPAYAALEKAAAIPESSILPQQALIFMNSRMGLPLKDSWWVGMIEKLKSRRPGVQDESSLAALAQCQSDGRCDLPTQRMIEAFNAALSHPRPTARLLATYSNYAWNMLHDRQLALRLMNQAVETAPKESAYRITQIRMLVALGYVREAQQLYRQLEQMNIGGNLDNDLQNLRQLIDGKTAHGS